MSRTLYGNALIGLVLGLLVFLPRGVEVLHALEKPPKQQAEPEPGRQLKVPAWVKQMRKLKVWRIRFLPSYRQEVTFDDNIFLNDRGEGRGREADLIITERPGVRMEFNYKKINLNVDYRGEVRQYVRHPELNTRQFAGDIRLDLDLGLDQDVLRIQKQRGRLYFKVSDDIRGRTDPVDLVNPALVARLENQLTLRTGLEFKGGEVYLSYQNRYLHVFNSEFKQIQNMQHDLTLGGKMQVSPRWSVELQVTPGLINFDRGTLSDQQFVEAVVRARGTLSAQLSTTIAAGYRHQRVIGEGDSGDDSRYSGAVFDASLRWDITRRTRLFVSAIRELQLSTVSNFKEATIGRISVVHELIPRQLIGQLQLEVNHQQASDGPRGSDPRNTRFLVALKLDYKFRSWLFFDITYRYQQNQSNQDDGDFYNNVVTLGVSFKF